MQLSEFTVHVTCPSGKRYLWYVSRVYVSLVFQQKSRNKK